MQTDFLRVTEVIKPFSGVEFIPDKYLIPAGDRGTLVHELIEQYLNGGFYITPPPIAKGYFDSFLEYERMDFDLDKKDLILEQRLYCEEKMITGAIDCIIPDDGGHVILDWKTSAKPSISWDLQAAAYKYLCEQNGYENVTEVIFVKLDKHGKEPKLFHFNDYEKSIDIFDKCLEIYHFFEMHHTRKKIGAIL